MTDQDALLQAVIAHPDDDLPRLVFADYLEEHGDGVQAEFIRLQCDLAHRAADDPDLQALLEREQELLASLKPTHYSKMFRGHVRFHRGFVESIHTTADWLVSSGELLFRTTPVRELRITNLAYRLQPFLHIPELSRIRALDLSNNNFAGGLHLEELFQTARLDALKSLTIRNAVLWPNAVEILANSRVAPQLRYLDLSGNPIADSGVRNLAEAPAFANLRSLILRNDEVQYHDSIHAGGAMALAASPSLRQLQTLDLADQYIGDAGFLAFVNSPNASRIEVLDVSFNEIGLTGERAAEELVASSQLHRLKQIHLGGNLWNRVSIDALKSWSKLAEGLTVDLRETELDAWSRQELQSSPWANRFLLDPGT
jgi:uncharacterized protein (TIGR02996 family)